MRRFPVVPCLAVALTCGWFCAGAANAQLPAWGGIISDTCAWCWSGALRMVNTDGSNTVFLTPYGDVDDNEFHPSAARTSDRIAFQSSRGTPGVWNIWTGNRDGTDMRPVTRDTDGTVWNQFPMISPDGSRIAFVANRNLVTVCDANSYQVRPWELFVINSDGSNLRKVTTTQVINCASGTPWSAVWSAAWSPDGTRLAFKGYRLVGDSGFHSLLGIINADGTNETVVEILDSSGAGIETALDWSPSGRYLLVSYGSATQGAPPRSLNIYDLQNKNAKTTLTEAQLGAWFLHGQGAVRFSPDSARLAYVLPHPDNPDIYAPAFIDLNGGNQTTVRSPQGIVGQTVWWASGAAIPTPARLELTPNPVLASVGGAPPLVVPTLFDAAGNVIVRAVSQWQPEDVNWFTVDYAGRVILDPRFVQGTKRLDATNGGITGTTNVTVAPAALFAAVLPASRSVQVGQPATAFATMINASAVPGIACGIVPVDFVPASFSYVTTDPRTNVVNGTLNTPVDIAAGASQSFVFAFTPTQAFAPMDVRLNFSCSNSAPASIVVGLNTLLLSASDTPVPDVVALAATLSGDGIANVGGAPPRGVFAVASVNVGGGGQVAVSADTGAAVLPLQVTLCQSNPLDAQCVTPIGPAVTTTIGAGATPTFSIFLAATGTVPFDPANNRVFVRFKDAGGVTRGSTSVAVRTVP
jgi:Tol biopolymer transport system component